MRRTVPSRAHAAVLEALIAARERAGLTQRELVDRLPRWLGLIQSAIAKIETGRRDISVVEAQEWCRAVGITVADLDERAVAIAEGRRLPAVRRKK